MSSRAVFYEGVLSAFGFLTSELGFLSVVPNSESTLESVCFEKSPLFVEVGWYKGEVDVSIRVTIDTSILRPYRRKSFGVAEIAKYLKQDVFRAPAALPVSAISTDQALVCVQFYAALMKEYCQDILRGDIKTLEEIVQKEAK